MKLNQQHELIYLIIMKHCLDDWWQTPLGDKGMELRELITESLRDLMSEMEEKKTLDELSRKSLDHVIKLVDKQYEILIDQS
jgi:hypothetical protein